MISKIYSATPFGFDGKIIEVEASLTRGLPFFNLVGMGDKTISESKDRVRNAIISSDLSFPQQKLTINLAPADFIKSGSAFDLPIAISILVISNQLASIDIKNKLFVGELSLSGKIRPVYGIINIVEAAKNAGITNIFLPVENLSSASIVRDVNLFPVTSLKQLFLHLKNQLSITPVPSHPYIDNSSTLPDLKHPNLDYQNVNHMDIPLNDGYTGSLSKKDLTDTSSDISLDDVYGNEFAKRAISLAIAGHHNLLLSGPPGSGKTMLIKASQYLLPPPSYQEAINIVKINELSHVLSSNHLHRPFRSPHHSSSTCAIIGGGSPITPGEISLANHGVLFLDELPEFSHQVIESLRQPLEDQKVTISRTKEKLTFPADFILFATMNPCPCGFLGTPHQRCICTQNQIQKYQKKISGPILDRIDIKVHIPYLENQKILENIKQHSNSLPKSSGGNSLKTRFTRSNSESEIKNRIQKVIKKQYARYYNSKNRLHPYNGFLKSSQLSYFIHLDQSAHHTITLASKKFNLSTRSLVKIIRLSRTIADFEDSAEVTSQHISEAISLNQF